MESLDTKKKATHFKSMISRAGKVIEINEILKVHRHFYTLYE